MHAEIMFVVGMRAFGPSAGRFYPVWKGSAPGWIDAVLLGSSLAKLVCSPVRLVVVALHSAWCGAWCGVF